MPKLTTDPWAAAPTKIRVGNLSTSSVSFPLRVWRLTVLDPLLGLRLQPALQTDRLLGRDPQLHAGQVPVYRSQFLCEPQLLPDVVRIK